MVRVLGWAEVVVEEEGEEEENESGGGGWAVWPVLLGWEEAAGSSRPTRP